jgi:hypothetical protein
VVANSFSVIRERREWTSLTKLKHYPGLGYLAFENLFCYIFTEYIPATYHSVRIGPFVYFFVNVALPKLVNNNCEIAMTPTRSSPRRGGALKLTLAFLLITCSSAEAQNSTYNFLRNDVSARSAAMAGSFVSMRNDVNAIFYNPAGLATMTQSQASFGYFKHLLDINAGYASYAQELSGIGMVGFGVNYVNYGTFDETDALANKLGTFGAGDIALSVGFAGELEENLSYGVTGKFIYSSIADARSSAIAADFGILYVIQGANPISMGASVLNLGTQLNPYIDTRENLPLEIKIGATIKPEHLPLLLSVNVHRLNDAQEDLITHFRAFSVGGEFTLNKELRFRFGFDNERRRDLKLGTSSGLAGFSFGGGLVLETLRFDYGYTSLGKIGSLNRVTVGMVL